MNTDFRFPVGVHGNWVFKLGIALLVFRPVCLAHAGKSLRVVTFLFPARDEAVASSGQPRIGFPGSDAALARF